MRKLLTILFCFASIIINATDYYVKNGGNDGAAGTSDGTAWATIDKKILSGMPARLLRGIIFILIKGIVLPELLK